MLLALQLNNLLASGGSPPTWTAAGNVAGTAVDASGVMGTIFLDDSTPVPATAVFINGFAHHQDGRRYVCLWPGTGFAYFHNQGGLGRRTDGSMLIDPSGITATSRGGWALTYRGEAIVTTNTPEVILGGFGLTQDGKLCVSTLS